MADLFPSVRVHPSPELRRQWVERWENPERAARYAKLVRDHEASVAEFLEHKRLHPDSRAGVIQYLRERSPYLMMVAATLTLDPLLMVAALAMKLEQFRRAKDRRI